MLLPQVEAWPKAGKQYLSICWFKYVLLPTCINVFWHLWLSKMSNGKWKLQHDSVRLSIGKKNVLTIGVEFICTSFVSVVIFKCENEMKMIDVRNVKKENKYRHININRRQKNNKNSLEKNRRNEKKGDQKKEGRREAKIWENVNNSKTTKLVWKKYVIWHQ